MDGDKRPEQCPDKSCCPTRLECQLWEGGGPPRPMVHAQAPSFLPEFRSSPPPSPSWTPAQHPDSHGDPRLCLQPHPAGQGQAPEAP